MQGFRSIYTNYILFPALALFTGSFPLPIAYNSVFTILLFIVFLVDLRNIKNNTVTYFSDIRNNLLLTIFISLLFSIFYSEDVKTGMKGILAAAPLIVVPLVMTTASNLSPRQIDILKKIFVFSCLITSIIYFIQTGIRIGLFDGSYRNLEPSLAYKSPYLVHNLTYHQLTPSIHAVFFSLYLAIAVILVIFDFKKKSASSKVLCGLLIFYLLVYLILLTSVTINFGLYCFLIACYFFKRSFKKYSHFLAFFCMILIGTATTDYLLIVKYMGPDIGDIVYKFDSPAINEKVLISFIGATVVATLALIIKLTNSLFFKYGLAGLSLIVFVIAFFYLKGSVMGSSNTLNNLSVRANYGAESFKIIKKNTVFGVGIGDKKFDLIKRDTSLGDKRYIEFGADTKQGDVFNPHNQFLDFWIAAGIIPVLCLALFFVLEFIKAFRYRYMPYLALIFIFFLFCITDKAMMVQRGQIFFLFFIYLFEMECRKKVTNDF